MVVSRLGGLYPKLTGRLALLLQCYPPDNRRRDADNIAKCCLDTLQAAGLYEDDSQIKDLRIMMLDPMPPDGMVYVELEEGAHLGDVKHAIKTDPYFSSDETHVFEVESVDEVRDMGHGVHMTRKGVSGKTQNQHFEFNMSINNPALTGQVLVNVARASMRQQPGCYTMIEIPVVDMLPGTREDAISHLV